VDEKGSTNLWLRPLNAQQATMLPGTKDASTPSGLSTASTSASLPIRADHLSAVADRIRIVEFSSR